jgi:hypothetical protein
VRENRAVHAGNSVAIALYTELGYTVAARAAA